MILKPRPFRKLRKGHWATKDLVGYWPYYEGDGNTVLDLSGNNHTGTFVGSPTWSAGKFGSVLNFPGTGSGAYVDFGDPINPSGNFSVFVWVNFQDLAASTEQIFGNGDNDDDDSGFYLFWYNNLLYCQVIHNGAGAKFITHGWTTTNQWVHVGLTFKANTALRFWVNGINVVSATTDIGTYVNSADNCIMGANAGGNNLREFEGLVDLPIIYNRILSASEITLLYREPFCMFERDSIELWLAATLGAAPPVGMAGAMTTNTGYWGW